MTIRTLKYIIALVFAVLIASNVALGGQNKADEMTLDPQLEKVLAEFDNLEDLMKTGGQAPSVKQIATLKCLVRSLETPGDCASRTTVSRSGKVQAAQPSGPVKLSGTPPGAEELKQMERSLDMTHLPGPPMKERPGTETAGQPGAKSQLIEDALARLDDIEGQLAGGQSQHARITKDLELARQAVVQSGCRSDSS